MSDEEWLEIFQANNTNYLNYEKLLISLKKGIKDKLRGKIWILLSKSMDTALNHSSDLYFKLVNTEDIDLSNQIKRDIDRTILNDNNSQIIDISSKKQKLFNILKAYAVYDSEVGYCQGTNYIVAVLLLNINSERACFWTFVQIMNDKNWRDLFINNTPKLVRMLEVLKNSVFKKIPDLYEYFEKIQVQLIINFISSWIYFLPYLHIFFLLFFHIIYL